MSKPVSFHYLSNAPYDRQINTTEALYIAHLLRALLLERTGKSIGIVAFSQAQQSEIERAIAELAEADTDFQNALDLEEEREADGQFVGLFVKNLENVQGDERDIVILSVCYGSDARGRMIMNFGPINQNGGEKRLNVIFSRARHHMMVVSSIKGTQITNVFNEGANALRHYLLYSEAASRGDALAMSNALLPYSDARIDGGLAGTGQLVADQIADALRASGLVASRGHGQSDFRCHVAVKTKSDKHYRLALFVDDDAHYRTEDIIDRHLTKLSILPSFGWRCFTVLAKDWQADRAACLKRIANELTAS